jgi:uncharacterized repeat protein (TIGR03837 family)
MRGMRSNRTATHWDLFCRVIDNHGDVGVCWRLAADLAERGLQVRLWIDDASALAWMAPEGAHGVEIRPWPQTDVGADPGDVVIEAFGCELPEFFVRRMSAATRPPVWINLEYLSAEGFVARAHQLPSPQPGGLRKWFFYPGFTDGTGGLLRERGLSDRRDAFDAAAWLASHAAQPTAAEEVVSLFCYEQPALPTWLDQRSHRPTLLLATAGHAARQVAAALGPTLSRGSLRAVLLPALTQIDYDHLLWASDLNLVRGEDSFVRAQWAGQPFVWQIYPQHDGAHVAKLEAFLAIYLADADETLSAEVRSAWDMWNAKADGAGNRTTRPIAPSPAWRRLALDWRTRQQRLPDLATRLIDFASETR